MHLENSSQIKRHPHHRDRLGRTGTLLFSKEGQSLSLTHSDTGFLPTEVSLSAFRAELERR